MNTKGLYFKKYALNLAVIFCFLGSGVLAMFGYVSGENATNSFTKIHPLSYFLIIISAIHFLSIGSLEKMERLIRFNAVEFRMLLSILLVLAYLLLSSNLTSISFIIDTLVCPVLFAINFRCYPKKLKRNARRLGLYLILVNSLIAIVERLFSTNIFPISTGYGEVFRSTALLGHPLNNALITIVFLLYVISISIPYKKKLYYVFIFLAALLCYGARGSLFAAILSILLLFVLPIFSSNRNYFKQINKINVLFSLGLVTLLVLFLIFNSPLGERLMHVSLYDSSAQVREESLKLIDFSNMSRYLTATSSSDMEMMSHRLDIGIIENFFIIWTLKFGAIFTCLLLLVMYSWFYLRMPIQSSLQGHITITILFLASATNNSLATSTTTLTLFVVIFCMVNNKERILNRYREK